MPHAATPTSMPTPPAVPTPAAPEPAAPACDPRRKFVRLIERRADGFVAFEFAIGWPELSVELLLPTAAFDEFCTTHQVQWLPRTPDRGTDPDDTSDPIPDEETRR